MASRLKLRKTPPQKGNDRGIQLGLIWLGKRLEPIDQDSRCQFYECTWQLGRYQRQTSRENEPYESEISNSPPMEFNLEINHERWEVDGYRIDVGYVEGHNHDFKRIGSICQWFAWKSITKATHAVDLDAPWHIQARFNAPTDNFLPSKHNNPGGKVTVIINMFRDGREKDRWKGIERFAWEVDDINKPLAQFIFKMSFQEIKEAVPQGIPQPSANALPLKEPLTGPGGPMVSNIANYISSRAELHKEDKRRSNLEMGAIGQLGPLIRIDEDVQKMTSDEKDREIMRLRKIVAVIRYERGVGNSAFSRDVSKAGL